MATQRPPFAQANDTWFLNTAARQIRTASLERAELLNGRMAMLGFVIGVAVEAATGHGILQQIAEIAALGRP